jgi:hypothetical protein
MRLRAVLLLAAATLMGAAIAEALDGSRLGFWLSAAAAFLGWWGVIPFSRPLLPQHRALVREQCGGSSADQAGSSVSPSTSRS